MMIVSPILGNLYGTQTALQETTQHIPFLYGKAPLSDRIYSHYLLHSLALVAELIFATTANLLCSVAE